MYQVELLSPNESTLTETSFQWTKRTLSLKPKSSLTQEQFPLFNKPFIPKIITARIYPSFETFQQKTVGLDDEEVFIASSILENTTTEAITFVHQKLVLDIVFYEGNGDILSAHQFLIDFIRIHADILPDSVVVDIGYQIQLGWFSIELNESWGAGLYRCKAEKVIDGIIAATKNKT